VLVDGDVYVAPTAKLIVKDGTVVKFTPHASKFAYYGEDYRNSGVREAKIIVAGELRFEGKKRGIKVGNPDKKGKYGWGGIYVVGKGKVVGSNFTLMYGLNGLIAESGSVELKNFTISDVSLVSLGFHGSSKGSLVSGRVKGVRLTGVAVHNDAEVDLVDINCDALPKTSNLTIGVEVLDKGKAKVADGGFRNFNYGFYLTDYGRLEAVRTVVTNVNRDKYPIGGLVKDFGVLKCFKVEFKNCEIGVQIEGRGKYEGGMVSFVDVGEELMK
jgi:hypothetical protein